MTDLLEQDISAAPPSPAPAATSKSRHRSEAFARRLRARHAAERRFRLAGAAAVALAALVLVLLLGSIVARGGSAFWETRIRLEVTLDPAEVADRNYTVLLRRALHAQFPQVTDRAGRRVLNELLSSGAPYELEAMVAGDASIIGTTRTVWVRADDEIDQLVKGRYRRDLPESERGLSDAKIAAADTLMAGGALAQGFNTTLFTAGDSREPEQAGIGGAIVGSLLTLLVTMALSVPVGVSAAVYLEEFAPKNRWTDLIEVNINNLAAVPSIIFGLLGLAVFLGFFGMPRSAPLVGGLVMALMTLPVIIIASRVALKSVPPSVREAALGIGASPLQTVLHHVLPLAMPGILTGTIIGMARALGETAPLLMIGMVAFIVDVPHGLTDSATVLPVQIYMWADSPERAFTERTSAAILILLGVLILLNGAAVVLRKLFERRW
ncbi:phosphate ABC transporter permease [Azospirillum thiophilum]|uniref:Phosphate transport system permease protein PstA n=1 Tax=Azospirillum thiophilum TaxID=528244 RepID=A0AAC8VW39_9PROT|nr:phosphate ABC transporter permease PstA [Azospirillum thiophilum]ALG70281.1 phosphate ABC transporter permease [Azospirillum thiophilum]KJR66042.1 phosphate ABC transporter permease [Azospirillum thiophilum]